MLHKDLALDRLAEIGNVAQYVALRPGINGSLAISTNRIAGFAANWPFTSVHQAIETLLARSSESAVNIRSYFPQDPRSREFVYRLTTMNDISANIERLSAEGLHLIVNETIDVTDGGVSGVVHGDIIEFAPDDTPRAVEKPRIASFPREKGLELLRRIYGFAIPFPGTRNDRIEFSIHPRPRGWRQTHILLWEIEAEATLRDAPIPNWPNRFSRHIGDKAFGLLIAEAYGAKVPRTLVISRRVAPFSLGQETGSDEVWTRTCPQEPRPGLYTTVRGWTDPFQLLKEEDSSGEIASVLAQNHIPAAYSGAAISGAQGLIVEGRAGAGDTFMLGTSLPDRLPEQIIQDVKSAYAGLSRQLGPVRIEWVHDGATLWVVQLHVGATSSGKGWLTQGDAEHWVEFDVEQGLAALRIFLSRLPTTTGLNIVGDFGLTSHIADVIRKWGGAARRAPRVR
ncbi:hypothetical protein [Novosphingobium sp. KACC 22771]|uniref:hypothetical protein n=1 Tax=Novosphingobium sp. KACC 22771 TaxID=3025670 RepID=UPI002366D126|nr:hypothetical protein [Novosphingobium sp. KACC 22771]WDF72300.1 hypothetical protein PQ467_16155 [Novosphingobium sp. KACC 22771]